MFLQLNTVLHHCVSQFQFVDQFKDCNIVDRKWLQAVVRMSNFSFDFDRKAPVVGQVSVTDSHFHLDKIQ